MTTFRPLHTHAVAEYNTYQRPDLMPNLGGLKEISVRLCWRCYHLQYSSRRTQRYTVRTGSRLQMIAVFDAGSLRCFGLCRYITFDLLNTDLISVPPFSTCTFP